MSFFDGMVSGFRTVFGIPEAHKSSSKGTKSDPRAVAEKAPAAARAATSSPSVASMPSLAERMAGAIGTPSSTSTTGSGAVSAADGVRHLSPPLAGGAASSLPPHLQAGSTYAPPVNDDPGRAALGDPWAASSMPSFRDGGAANVSTPAATASSAVNTSAQARVFDASAPDASGAARLVGTTGQLLSSTNQDARVAATNVQGAIDYYARTFGRDGIDGKGSGVDVVLNDHSKDAAGAEIFKGNGGYYATPTASGVSEAIRYGSGNAYNHARGGTVSQYSMLYADDLAIHEFTHGVIRKETGKLGGDADESGATNEGVADVMAAAATRDWRIGEKMYSDASTYKMMRNIANPNDPTAVHGLWTSVGQVRSEQAGGKEAEEHWASGVVSTAAYRMQQRIGGEAGWKAVEQVFYGAIAGHRLGTMSFADVASGLRAEASEKFGAGSDQYRAFDEELRRGGM